MTFSDLASIGSLVSGFAVLVSLIYLGLQVRQTERNQRALMNQGVTNRASENIRWLAEPHMVGLETRVAAGETQFSAEELLQLAYRLRTTLVSAQDAYVQYKAGLTDQITWDGLLGATRAALVQPVYRAIWRWGRWTYAPDWVAYIDKLIDETPLAEPADAVAQFKAHLAEVMR
jgi:hypothetical protein